jgi:hypothetical protein
MRKMIVLVAALGLVAVGCGGGDGAAASCAGVVDETMNLVQGVVDEIDNMSVDDIMTMSSTGEDPEFIADFQTKMEALSQQADELGCTDAELTDLAKDRMDNLTAKTDIGQMMVDNFKNSTPFQ